VNAATIKVHNLSGGTLSNSSGYRVSLLIYNNHSSAGATEWVTYASDVHSSFSDGITNITLTRKLTNLADVPIDATMRIAFGTHILLLIDNDKLALGVDGDIVYRDAGGNAAYQKINIFPGAILPNFLLKVDA